MRHGTRWLAVAAAMLALALATAMAGAQMTGTPGAGMQGQGHGGGMMATPGQGMGMGPSSGNGVVYVTITNTGDEDDALIGGETDRAGWVEIHEMVIDGQVARMQPVDGPLVIPAGETVSLEPGGLHLMLINLTEDNRAGDVFELTLTFVRAGEVTLQVPVRMDAEPTGDDPASETVEAGDLVLEGAWSRPAPRLGMDGATPMATPAATPAS